MNSGEMEQLKKRLKELEGEKESILTRINFICSSPVNINETAEYWEFLGMPVTNNIPTTSEEKIALFLKLFKCQESVYPKLWENYRAGKKGYSPACHNEWTKGICDKRKVKCSECPNKDFLPLDEKAVQSHLIGKHTIGTYTIRSNNTCIFLACDFDGSEWKNDALAYQMIAESLGIQACIERSRSGNGAHVWIFFSEPIWAGTARRLGTIILTKAIDFRHTISFKSFDRFFPNQDYMPKGGFGNLIALPLQKVPRHSNNSVFIDKNFHSFPNQWEYLASIKRLSRSALQNIIDSIIPDDRENIKEKEQDIVLKTDEKIIEAKNEEIPTTQMEGTVEIVFSSQIIIPIKKMTSSLISKLKRSATFPNPRFYELQRMRMSTYPHPRFIFSGEITKNEIMLPRGMLDKVTNIIRKAGASFIIHDKRQKTKKIKLSFKGELTKTQKRVASQITKYEMGVLVAPPGFGKTILACSIIAKRKVPTLILVHRQPLVEQWKERIIAFLGLDKKEIGEFCANKKKRSEKIDLAMLQTLSKVEDVVEITKNYGQIIIDECHHIPATSFEYVLKNIPVKYILGLTATPYRKDRLEKIIFQQCGPIRHEIKISDDTNLHKKVVIRETNFRLPEEAGKRPPYHILIDYLMKDIKRQNVIIDDLKNVITSGKIPLVISDRKEYLQLLESKINSITNKEIQNLKIFRIDGSFTKKQRRIIFNGIKDNLKNFNSVCILATCSLIGEGFDLPELDTLMLAFPLSFKGRLIQYAGRPHRTNKNKESVMIYDYLDSFSAVTYKMYKNRLKTYREMGYEIEKPYTCANIWSNNYS